MRETKNFIDAVTSLEEVTAEMKKIGKNYMASKQNEARLLADWMYRFGVKIEKLAINRKQVSQVNEFVRTLETASETTKGSLMMFK